MKDGSKCFFTKSITPPVEARVTSFEFYIDFTSIEGRQRQRGSETGSRKLIEGLQQIMLRGDKSYLVKEVKYDIPSTCLRISSKNTETMFVSLSMMDGKMEVCR